MSLNSLSSVLFSSRVLGIAAVLSLCGSASAATFSFASDDESDAFTFLGTAGIDNNRFNMTHARTPRDRVTLKIDDNNGARPTVSLSVGFTASFTLNYVGSLGMANAQTHAYSVTGNFAFVDVNTGANLLTISVTGQSPAGMTIGGTGTQWASAGGLFGSDNLGGGSVEYTTTPALFTAGTAAGADLTQYGIFSGASAGTAAGVPDDFGFSLTFVNASGGPVGINSGTHLPTAVWNAEGSYSGSARWVPAPGTVSMLGLAGLMVGGRRRR